MNHGCFTTIRRQNSKRGFTLAEIMMVVAFIGFLIAIAVPTFFRARELSRQRACQENLQKINGSKYQWAMETNQAGTAVPVWSNLVGVHNFIRTAPECPGGGTYAVNAVDLDATCSLGTQEDYPHVPPEGGS